MFLSDAMRKRLDVLMKEKNLTSYQVSYKAGLNPSVLNDFIRGRIACPRINTFYLICIGLGVTLEEFFKDSIFNEENIEIKDSND